MMNHYRGRGRYGADPQLISQNDPRLHSPDPNEANYGTIDRRAPLSVGRPWEKLLGFTAVGGTIGALAVGGPVAIIGGVLGGWLVEEMLARLSPKNQT